jgi:hypothetical protein
MWYIVILFLIICVIISLGIIHFNPIIYYKTMAKITPYKANEYLLSYTVLNRTFNNRIKGNYDLEYISIFYNVKNPEIYIISEFAPIIKTYKKEHLIILAVLIILYKAVII